MINIIYLEYWMETSAWKMQLEAALQVDYFAHRALVCSDFEQVRSKSYADVKSNFLSLTQEN